MRGARILLGVTGSIAAYKSAALVRLLVKEGADVRIIMTDAATDFITPLTLSTLSKHPVRRETFDAVSGTWDNHVDLGLWADLFVIAPASANTLAKLANGYCDNLLTAVYLSSRCPVWAAPAMDLDMWKHPATVSSLEKLKAMGIRIISPAHGELASGLVGEGRMEEPEQILETVKSWWNESRPLVGMKALVTAGPTFEPIDPVRFIGNHSSGKMGFALAGELAKAGASVTLVTGPVSLADPPGIRQRISVMTALEMEKACMDIFDEQDVVVMSAAVADYRPEKMAAGKIKKIESGLTIGLVRNPDILAAMGARKSAMQLLVGFALETDEGVDAAQEKLHRKNLDLIVLNSLQDAGAGFRHDTNRVTLIRRDGSHSLPLLSKTETARHIVEFIRERWLTDKRP
jgi:phosphopantothenoylcysteine decarboxylase/phosphopantothenate--cysteine ligase